MIARTAALLAALALLVLVATVAARYWLPERRSHSAQMARVAERVAEERAALAIDRERVAHTHAVARMAQVAPLATVSAAALALLPALGVGSLALLVAAAGHLYLTRVPPLVWPDRRGVLPLPAAALADGTLTPESLALLSQWMQQDAARPRVTVQDVPQHYAPHITLTGTTAGRTAPPAALEEEEPAPLALPVAPPFAQVVAAGFQPSLQRMILGYQHGGPVHGTIDDLLSTLVIGRPGTGKTTALRFLLAQLVAAGSEVALLDPHGSLAEIGDIPARWRAESASEMGEVTDELLAHLDERLARYRAGERAFRPLLLLVDEWNILAEMHKPAVELARRYILEARKVRAYALISGQGAPAASFGGSLARDGMSSRLILWTTAQQARMAGLEAESARDLLPRLAEGPVGRAILARSSAEPEIVAIPNTTAADLARSAATASHHCRPTSATASASQGSEAVVIAGFADLEADRQRVRGLLTRGYSQNKIIEKVWGVTGGRRYRRYSEFITAVVAQELAS